MDGAPKTKRFDNLSTAVKKVLPNEGFQLIEEFQYIVLHYGFKYGECNPNKGMKRACRSNCEYLRFNYILRVFMCLIKRTK